MFSTFEWYLLSGQCPQCTLQHRRMMAPRHTQHTTRHMTIVRIALFCSTSHTAHDATNDTQHTTTQQHTPALQHYNTTTRALLSLLLYVLDRSSTHAEVDLYKRICPQRISRSDFAAECLGHCKTTTAATKRREGGVAFSVSYSAKEETGWRSV